MNAPVQDTNPNDRENLSVFGAPSPSEGTDSVDLLAPMMVLWSYRRMIAIITAAVMGLAVLFALSLPPEFRAIAQLTLGNEQQNYTDIEGVVTGIEIDDETFGSELGTIMSNRILRKVIIGLRLDQDANYNTLIDTEGPGPLSRFGTWLRSGGNALVGTQEAGPDVEDPGTVPEPVFTSEQAMDRSIRTLRRSLSVDPMGNSFIVNVSATAASPRKAALVANAVANAYVLDQFETLESEGARATSWFSERLEELQTRISSAEDQLERRRIDQLETFGESERGLEARLEELNRRLALAQAERVTQDSRYDRVRAAEGDREKLASLPEVLNSDLTDGLRADISRLTGDRAKALTRFGSNHPDVQSLVAQINDLQAGLDAEIDRIASAIINDVERARSVEERLTDNIRDIELKRISQQQAMVDLRAIEAEVETNRQIYLEFLTRYREVSETATLLQPDARIISDARPPQFSSGTSKRLIVGLAGVLGFGLGCLAVLLVEALNQTIRAGAQAERLLDLPHLASLPRVSSLKWQRRPLMGDGHQPRMFAESLRSLTVRLTDRLSDGHQVVGVTSADVAAGKSILASTLAETMAETNRNVILLECDIYRPQMGDLVLNSDEKFVRNVYSRILTTHNTVGAADVTKALAACIQTTDHGFDFLRIGGVDEGAREFFNSAALPETFDQLCEQYDIIIVNLPPILAVSDTLHVLRHLDAALLAIRWSRTTRTSLRSAIKKAGRLKEKMLGIVLTDVHPKRAPKEEIALLSTEAY